MMFVFALTLFMFAGSSFLVFRGIKNERQKAKARWSNAQINEHAAKLLREAKYPV